MVSFKCRITGKSNPMECEFTYKIRRMVKCQFDCCKCIRILWHLLRDCSRVLSPVITQGPHDPELETCRVVSNSLAQLFESDLNVIRC